MSNDLLPVPITPLQLTQLPKFVITSDLDGSQGTNRDRKNRCQINAERDHEAIQCWLNEYRHKATTYRTYQKESERFVLWCVHQQKKAFSSVDRADMESYINFLDDPLPKEMWCAKPNGRRCTRGSIHWRPFVGGLSASAKATALSAIDSLFNYLVYAQYLLFNPLGLIRKRSVSKKINDLSGAFKLQERILDLEEWNVMLDVMENLPEGSPDEKKEKMRLQFLVKILYYLGLRIEELSTHTWGAFKKIENQWWFFVIGKGSKPAKIPVNDELLRVIIHYRIFLHKAPLPTPDETAPLIHSFRTGQKISMRHMNTVLKTLALETAKKFTHQPEKEKKLKKFSAHWLRHLSASMQDRTGIAFKHIRGNLRHENDETTRRYVHALDDDRHQDMQKLTLRIPVLPAKLVDI